MFYLYREDVEEFIFDLECLHLRELENREANFLISPAIFDPDHPDRKIGESRGCGNIRYLQHLWLDFENGELQPAAIAELFPHHRLVVMNTFNHTPEKPRFRAIFLTSGPLTPEAYEELWDQIAAKIEDSGYWFKQAKPNRQPSGLDYSKRTAASIFYAPCQAKNPADSFFTSYNEGRDLLDPMIWIENSLVPAQEPFVANNDQSPRVVDQAAVDLATKKWRQSRQCPGKGNEMFFAYALALRQAGMDLSNIEQKLSEEARFGRTPDERKHQIPSIIASLRPKSQAWV
jgi:hypothetical protein